MHRAGVLGHTHTNTKLTRVSPCFVCGGSLFFYEDAASDYASLDKLITYLNQVRLAWVLPSSHTHLPGLTTFSLDDHTLAQDGRVNAFYSTPQIYSNARNAETLIWPMVTSDFFPYSNQPVSLNPPARPLRPHPSTYSGPAASVDPSCFDAPPLPSPLTVCSTHGGPASTPLGRASSPSNG